MKILYALTVGDHVRNNGLGDYDRWQGMWRISTIDTKNRKINKLILIHELIEQMLTEEAGIKEKDINKFDMEFEKDKRKGEPGNAKDSPYRRQHQLADKIMSILARELNIDEDGKKLLGVR